VQNPLETSRSSQVRVRRTPIVFKGGDQMLDFNSSNKLTAANLEKGFANLQAKAQVKKVAVERGEEELNAISSDDSDFSNGSVI